MTKLSPQDSLEQSQKVLTTNGEYLDRLKKNVDESDYASFLCTTIKIENPNYLSIIHANDIFCQTFKITQDELIGKSYDFLLDEIDVNYSSEDQLEYIRMIKSVKTREECSILLNLDNHLDENHQIAKFKIGFKPIIEKESQKFYAIFSFEKIGEEAVENDEIKLQKENIKSQNQTLVKNLERALSNEKLLREISYLIISDKPVKEIAQSISQSLCKVLKIDRCLIHDKKDGEANFIIEFCNPQVKSILNDGGEENGRIITEEYVKTQGNFYEKIRANSQNDTVKNSTLFIANDIKSDPTFSNLKDFYQKFSINSQVAAIISFDNEVNGAIYIHSSENRNFTVDEIELIEIIADQLSIAIDRSYSIEKVMIANHNLLTKTLELKEAIKKEKEMRKMQTEFVALVSHEFKTPLQIIDSTRELIARKAKSLNISDDNFNKYLERIKNGIQRMTGLINSTLNLAKMESGNSEINVNKQEFNLNDLLLEVIEKASNLALNKNIKINVNFCQNDSRINADQKLLDHCFTNILANAVKYSKDNSEVSVITKCNENKIAVRVIDHGIGIPKDDVAKIGQKFFRAKNTLSVSETGIGIYLTKYFVELHNGSVNIESEINVGTSFTVILPRK